MVTDVRLVVYILPGQPEPVSHCRSSLVSSLAQRLVFPSHVRNRKDFPEPQVAEQAVQLSQGPRLTAWQSL